MDVRMYIAQSQPGIELSKVSDGLGMCCPVCGFNHVHIEKVRHQPYAEHDGYTVVTFSAECGHRFTVTFHEHEGQTEVSTARIKDDPQTFAITGGR